MSTRVQVILEVEEKEHFQRQAEAEGLSLSAWLRKAGETRLHTAHRTGVPSTAAELRKFFEQCSAREAASGEKEPDWPEHLSVIEASRRSGRSLT